MGHARPGAHAHRRLTGVLALRRRARFPSTGPRPPPLRHDGAAAWHWDRQLHGGLWLDKIAGQQAGRQLERAAGGEMSRRAPGFLTAPARPGPSECHPRVRGSQSHELHGHDPRIISPPAALRQLAATAGARNLRRCRVRYCIEKRHRSSQFLPC